MHFGLKNARATYQSAMQNIFDNILDKNVECYVDDLVVKSRKKCDHLQDLRMVFDLLRRYQLRMNHLKCAFGVTSGKFLGFIVQHRGIEIDQVKLDAILKMVKPRNIHELKSLHGKLTYLRRFISNLAGKCQPFSRLMKKGTLFEWDQACSNAFESIKSYLTKPPVLAAPVPGKPLILYISAQERSVGALLDQENDKGKENSLYYLSRRMTPNELKYSLIEKLCLALVFLIQKMKHYFQAHVVRLISKANPIKFAVKGQALADFLADHPIHDDWELTDELPDEDAMVVEVQPPWKMYFDGASHREGAGAGQITICQKWIVPLDVDEESKFEHLVAVSQAEIVDWRHALIDYLCYNILPEDPKKRTEIRRRAPRFLYYKDTLYRRSFEGILLRCLGEEEAIQTMQEAHSGVCGSHQSGPKLHFHIKRMGYCWPTMVKDCLDYARRCQACQFHANFMHQPPDVLHLTVASWPFNAWGLDVVGPLPKSFGGHLYILAMTDYFSKWAEAVALKEVKKENVANFIRVNIIVMESHSPIN
ncbi:uncharacterized protein LOC125837412 [Solanum verrucosum]|uniref:uncharacterized protein LOC125837412 n=1 Tax=Solanum verrucosum TaxID=315347 RepID=UPI0020D14BC7|nr:uncharacterized protein LOC125837412 [Solanum verrucosum]